MSYLKIDMLHLYLKLLFSSYDADESIVNCCQRRITKTECARNCDIIILECCDGFEYKPDFTNEIDAQKLLASKGVKIDSIRRV